MWLGCTCRNWRDDEEEGSLDRCWGRNWLNKLWNVWGKRWNGRFVQPLRNQNRRRAETASRVSTQRNVTKPERVFFFFFVVCFREGSFVQHRPSERQQVKKSIRRNEAFIRAHDTAVTTPVWQSAAFVSGVHLFMCFHIKTVLNLGLFWYFCLSGWKKRNKKNRAATKCQPSVSV